MAHGTQIVSIFVFVTYSFILLHCAHKVKYKLKLFARKCLFCFLIMYAA
jgi:hypothetical protein